GADVAGFVWPLRLRGDVCPIAAEATSTPKAAHATIRRPRRSLTIIATPLLVSLAPEILPQAPAQFGRDSRLCPSIVQPQSQGSTSLGSSAEPPLSSCRR